MYITIIFATILLNSLLKPAEADLVEVLNNIQSYFWSSQDVSTELDSDFNHRIPYEVSAVDEKFIAEAAKLTGVELSRLDSCQHAVVLKLQTDCDKMNDEMVAKMAVALLNCQSLVEGRKLYPCTTTMSLKDCTTNMDADTWNTYHLMTNRVKAVCYSIRQIHFRGLTEQTINKLMHTSQSQLKSLGDIAAKQETLKNLALQTMDSLEQKNRELLEQHNDLHKAQLFSQLSLEDNINRLVDEKRLITDSQDALNDLTEQMRSKLLEAIEDLEQQAAERADNHQELVSDLKAIQTQANEIFKRIEESSALLLQQTEAAQNHYRDTIQQLAAVNETMRFVVALVSDSREALEERLSWLAATVGGANLTLVRLQTISAHLAMLFLGMVICAFLSAHITTRLLLVITIPINLALSIFDMKSLQMVNLMQVLAATAIASRLIFTVFNRYLHPTLLPQPLKSDDSESKTSQEDDNLHNRYNGISAGRGTTNNENSVNINNYRHNNSYSRLSSVREDVDGGGDDSVSSGLDEHCTFGIRPTPPRSRTSDCARTAHSRSRTPALSSAGDLICQGFTRLGTPCKSKASKETNYCFRHQSGSSVLGSM